MPILGFEQKLNVSNYAYPGDTRNFLVHPGKLEIHKTSNQSNKHDSKNLKTRNQKQKNHDELLASTSCSRVDVVTLLVRPSIS